MSMSLKDHLNTTHSSVRSLFLINMTHMEINVISGAYPVQVYLYSKIGYFTRLN